MGQDRHARAALSSTAGYVRGVGVEVVQRFRRTMAELGWSAVLLRLSRMLAPMADRLCEIARDTPVIVDHYGMVDARRGVNEENFQALLRLVGEGHVHGVRAVPRLHAVSGLSGRAAIP
jgi:predicted TIM-barrel fold metal-dependent hydrolase